MSFALVSHTFRQYGGLWPRDKILLKLTEELGEVVRAFRKKTPAEQVAEVGDLGFALYALCCREGINLDAAVLGAVEKHVAALEAEGVSP